MPDVPEVSPLAGRTLRVAALYPERLNIYADRGNLLVLERRCAWRGIGFELAARNLGDALDPDAHDLLYLGGGQDRDQRLCAEDLVATKRQALHDHADRGGAVLAVCGGYQLLGHHYAIGPDDALPGVGLLDLHTERGPERLIGNVAIEVELPAPGGGGMALPARTLAGFENHAGRTILADGQPALGRVLSGHGNTGASGAEGARRGNVVGTYLHGPLLPKNAWFADWLIATALGVELAALTPLNDVLEDAGHRSARRAAGLDRGITR